MEFTAEGGETELQTETQGDTVNQETHMHTDAHTHTHTDAHPRCINSRQSYPVISLLMKSALMTWM